MQCSLPSMLHMIVMHFMGYKQELGPMHMGVLKYKICMLDIAARS